MGNVPTGEHGIMVRCALWNMVCKALTSLPLECPQTSWKGVQAQSLIRKNRLTSSKDDPEKTSKTTTIPIEPFSSNHLSARTLPSWVPGSPSPGPLPGLSLFLLLVVDVAGPLLLGHPSLQRPAKYQGSHRCDIELPATNDKAEKVRGRGAEGPPISQGCSRGE